MQKQLIGLLMIFGVSCTRNIPLQNDVCVPIVCQSIYGRATDWDIISDELARNIFRHNEMCQKLINDS